MKKQLAQAGQTIVVTASRAPHWFWYIVGAIILIVVIYYWGKRKGKADPIDIELPTGAAAIPSNWNPNPLIEDLHDVLDSTTFSPWAWDKRDKAFNSLLNLPNDDMFVFVNNEYNKRYQGEMKKSLKEQISSEGMLGAWNQKKESILNRMNKLNIV